MKQDRTQTGADGRLSTSVSPGSYDVIVDAPNFLKVSKHIEAKSGMHQTVAFVLEARPCASGPCLLNTDVLPVSFPEQSSALSPNGRYAIIGDDRDTGTYHSLFLEDRLVKTRRRIFNYDRRVLLVWNLSSNAFAVTDYVAKDSAECRVVSVDAKVPPIQVLDVLSRQLPPEKWKDLQAALRKHHVSVEAVEWSGSGSLLIKISENRELRPESFTGFYEVVLPAKRL